MTKTVVVIGGGVGGLCAAARLSCAGYKVTVVEKEDRVGGRANRLEKDGYTFDMGPTLLMMTDVLYSTFADCGKNLDDYLQLIQLEPNYQVIFGNSKRITMSSNLPKLCEELRLFDSKAPEQFYRYFSDVAEFYRVSRLHFIDKNFNKLTDFINPKQGLGLLKKHGLSKLWDFTGRYFSNENLRQLFSFQSMYLGVSPFEAPAVYSTVSYMETGLGIWYPKGGMYSLSLALQKLCMDLGVNIKTKMPVDEIIIEDNKACGVRTGSKTILADIVLTNADLVYAHKNLIPGKLRPHMPDTKLDRYKQASSALLFYFGVDDQLEGLLHHNVLLSKNFKRNFEQIFNSQKMPTDPAFYVYVPTKTDPSLAPRGKHVMYVLVPVPNLEAKIDWSVTEKVLKQKILVRLKKEFKIDIKPKIETQTSFSPLDFQTKFNLYNGSAFGLSHHFFQSGYFRPHNYSKDIENLYFVGASTYPGGGIPMVTLSAKLVVERILNAKKH